MAIDSAIFAQQKSNQYGGAIAPTDTRPLRGVQSLEKGGSSASARSGKSEALPPKDILCGCAKSGDFFGALRVRGEGKPFFFCANKRF